VRVDGFDRTPRQRKTDGIFRHPWTPKQKEKDRFTSLRTDRPAWTSLADWIGGTRGDQDIVPAPVVHQWFEQLRNAGERTSLLLLDYGTNKASITHRFVESFPLSSRIAERELADGIAARVRDAERTLDALRRSCIRVHMKIRPGRDAMSGARKKRANTERELLHDTTASFWRETEPFFWRVYDALTDESEDHGVLREREFSEALQRLALSLFDRFTAPSLGDPGRIALIAEVRRQLRRDVRIAMGLQAAPLPLARAMRRHTHD
jgi:hypothetical protein